VLTRRLYPNSLVTGVILGLFTYSVGLVLFFIEARSVQNPLLFASRYPGFHLAVLGNTFVMTVYASVSEKAWSVVQREDVRACFDNTTDEYEEYWRKAFRTAFDNKGSVFGAAAWIIFIVWRVVVHYPEPIQGFSTYPYECHSYCPLEWYILGVFLFSMAILGTGCWNILGGIIALSRAQFRILPERARDLRRLNTYLIVGLAAWYLCVAVSAPVLVLFSPNTDVFVTETFLIFNPITTIQSGVGIVLFLSLQILFHRFVLVVKNERLQQIGSVHRRYYGRLLDAIQRENNADALLRYSLITSAVGSMIRQVEELPTWLVDLSAVVRFSFSTFVSVVATRSIQILLGTK